MPLHLIHGPPNSGRTEELQRRFTESLPKSPILVLPSTDDIFAWERRLMRADRAFLGARIMHFKDLVAEVLDLDSAGRRSTASALQRRDLTVAALESAWPQLARRVEYQPGLIDSMLNLIDEFRGAQINPDTLDRNIAGQAGDYLRQIAGVYRCFVEGLAERELTDGPELATAATRAMLDGWSGTPVFMAGYDDLTRQQLDLLVGLAEVTDVTVAITREIRNPAMAVTQALFDTLEPLIAGNSHECIRDQKGEHTEVLFEIERSFMRPGAAGQLKPDGSITIMRSTGSRGEAEAIAAEIAILIDQGVEPGEIAITVPSPATDGGRFREVLAECDVPATLECETAATATATGQAALDLLEAAAADGSAEDLFRYLRGPLGMSVNTIDTLERLALRAGIESSHDVVKLMEGRGEAAPPGWQELSGERGPDAAAAVRQAITHIVGLILNKWPAGESGGSQETETQIATAILRACDELEELSHGSVTRHAMSDALTCGAIKTWAIPKLDTVRIASPYSLRAKRFEYLFMASLQESGATAGDRSGPFLTTEAREAVKLPEFTDPELQELYLFYSCLSVPTKGLWLSSRTADENGKQEFPSPLVDGVVELFEDAGAGLQRAGRTGSALLFDLGQAPSETDLARRLAARGPTGKACEIPELELSAEAAERIDTRIQAARSAEAGTRKLASLESKAAISKLVEKDTFSATALEAFTSCPYRWFIDRALNPSRFGPPSQPMAKGNLIHRVLRELYAGRIERAAKIQRSKPGWQPEREDLMPTETTIEAWIAEVDPAVEREAGDEEVGLDSESPEHRTARRKAASAIVRYLRIEAARSAPRLFPMATEAEFGMGEAGKAAIEMDGWKLGGSIDRIDASPDRPGCEGERLGVVLDYKSGGSSFKTWANIKKEKKLQLQLYLHAMQQAWGLQPVGGLYVPLFRGDGKSRGPIESDFADTIEDLNKFKNDECADLGDEIAAAIAEADQVVERIRHGLIDHDPNTCLNHFEHAAVPDRRLYEAGTGTPGAQG